MLRRLMLRLSEVQLGLEVKFRFDEHRTVAVHPMGSLALAAGFCVRSAAELERRRPGSRVKVIMGSGRKARGAGVTRRRDVRCSAA